MADPDKPIIEGRPTAADDKPATTSSDNGGVSAPRQSSPITPAGSTSSSSSTLSTSTTVPVATAVPAQFTAKSYAELIPQLEKRMGEYKPLSEEELKKLRRRQKVKRIISGISDAAQAVANLIFTHHYAPNMYNPKEGMSAKAKERFDKEKAKRDADADKYLQYALTIGKMRDSDKERGLQAWKTEQILARQAQQDEWKRHEEDRKQVKEEFDARKRELELKLLEGKISRDEYKAEKEQLELEYMKKNNKKMPVTPTSSGGSGRGGSSGGQSWIIENDKTGEQRRISARSKEHAANQVPDGWSLKNGVVVSERSSTSDDGFSTKTTSTRSTRSYQTGSGSETKPDRKNGQKKKTNVKWK